MLAKSAAVEKNKHFIHIQTCSTETEKDYIT